MGGSDIMQQYIKTIKEIIDEQISQISSTVRIKLESFPHPQIYWEVCNYYQNEFEKQKKDFIFKLSQPKYENFQKFNNTDFIPYLNKLKNKDFVDSDNHMTHWRNKIFRNGGVIFFLGTELIEDRGGLADFYTITPQSISKKMDKKAGNWFYEILGNNKDEMDELSLFFASIFKHIPENLFKLSEKVDDFSKTGGYNSNDIIEKICQDFWIDWEIPNILNAGSFPVKSFDKKIAEAIKFRDRAVWKDNLTDKKLKDLKIKFDKWKKEDYTSEEAQLINKYFDDLDDFEEKLFKYIKGEEIDKLRPKLCSIDFTLIRTILGISINGHPTNKREIILKGDPFIIFAEAILLSLKNKKENKEINEIKIVIQNLELAFIAVKRSDKTDLKNEIKKVWEPASFFLGGLFDFILSNWQDIEKDIAFSFDKGECFTPSKIDDNFNKGIIKAGTKAQKLHKLRFKIKLLGPNFSEDFSYRWDFGKNDGWLNSFLYIKIIHDDAKDTHKKLLYGNLKDFNSIIVSSNEDEYFELISQSDVSFHCIKKLLVDKLKASSSEDLLVKIDTLIDDFYNFVNELIDKGFFSTFHSSSLKFISTYNKNLRFMIDTSFTQQVAELLYLFTNAFILTKVKDDKLLKKGAKGAIIPPYHPAMLEKIKAKYEFMREGFLEILNSLLSEKPFNISDLYRLEQLSTITSGVDLLVSEKNKEYLTLNDVYGYYGLYGEGYKSVRFFTKSNLLNQDIISEDEYDEKDFKIMTPISKLIKEKICEYLDIFPSKIDGISLTFINPQKLEAAVAGIHASIEELKRKEYSIKIKTMFLLPSSKQSGKGFLQFWLDKYFQDDDIVTIETYFSIYDSEHSNLKDIMFSGDIVFIENIMKTNQVEFEEMLDGYKRTLSDLRFPIVFLPLPIFLGSSNTRKSSLTQIQFEVAFLHSQLIRKLDYPSTKKGNYRVIKKTVLPDYGKNILDIAHEKFIWVVCIDKNIDKELMKLDRKCIISFATGKGHFGEMNVTISTKDTIQDDIKDRLILRLTHRFPDWEENIIKNVASYCLEQSEKLDGLNIIKALNPLDYELHDYLAYLLMAETLGIYNLKGALVKSLIPLDSYSHWFSDCKRPDFLLLEIDEETLDLPLLKEYSGKIETYDIKTIEDSIPDKIIIDACLIECKLGQFNDDYIEKAEEQIISGWEILNTIWNPDSKLNDRRYWYTQLYRAIVFSVINQPSYQNNYLIFTKVLLKIIEGHFEIRWKAALYTFWLNSPEELGEEVSKILGDELAFKHFTFGYKYIQKMLLPENLRGKVEISDFPLNLDEAENMEVDESIEDYPDEEPEEVIPEIEEVGDIEEHPVEISEKFEEDNVTPSEISGEEDIISYKKPEEEGGEDIKVGKEQDSKLKLQNLKLLIGEDIYTKEKVYWEYGHKQLPNRHLLISGNSGTGKTYCIQCLLLELSKAGISSVIFDYTDGFTDAKLEPEFKRILGSKIIQKNIYHKPFPINPFQKYDMLIAGNLVKQSDIDVAERVRDIFHKVYSLGEQQANAIYKSMKEGLKIHQEQMSLSKLQEELLLLSDSMSNAKTVLSKIEPLVDRNPFIIEEVCDWSELLKEPGQVLIIQLSGFSRDIQLLITEVILWDAWYYNIKAGDKSKPFPVVLDEAQNLDHREKAPSAKILTEGRKFGWSGWFATQFMKDQLKKDEIQRLQQSSQKLFFCPPEAEQANVSSFIEPDKKKVQKVAEKLAKLKKGHCYVSGYSRINDQLAKQHPRIVKVTSLEERE